MERQARKQREREDLDSVSEPELESNKNALQTSPPAKIAKVSSSGVKEEKKSTPEKAKEEKEPKGTGCICIQTAVIFFFCLFVCSMRHFV